MGKEYAKTVSLINTTTQRLKKKMCIFSLLCIKQIHGTDPMSKIRRHLMTEQHIALAAMTS